MKHIFNIIVLLLLITLSVVWIQICFLPKSPFICVIMTIPLLAATWMWLQETIKDFKRGL